MRDRDASDRLFRAARRHSRTVHAMRWGLPIMVVVVTAIVGIAAWLNPLQMLTRLPVELGSVVVSGTKITMQQPRLAGVTRDARLYEVVATAAAQDVTNPDVLELEGVRASLELRDNTKLDIRAQRGLYNNKTELLTLRQEVVILSANYQAWLNEAVFDVRKNTLLSETPVTVKMLQSTITANRLEVTSSGEVIHFDRGVTVEMDGLGESKQ
jgi:lipopolysaccharide export system protein LptC